MGAVGESRSILKVFFPVNNNVPRRGNTSQGPIGKHQGRVLIDTY